MRVQPDSTYIAFHGTRRVSQGAPLEVAGEAKDYLIENPEASLLIFDAVTSTPAEFDFQGSPRDVIQRLKSEFAQVSDSATKPAGPGRPRLGVTSKEISLLPRQWEWLAEQPGGASATLRKLVDEARKRGEGRDVARRAQDATYKFMNAVAGDLPHYEESLRALYAKNASLFTTLVRTWPADVARHVLQLSEHAF